MFHQGLLSGQEACRTVGKLTEISGDEKNKVCTGKTLLLVDAFLQEKNVALVYFFEKKPHLFLIFNKLPSIHFSS